MSSVAELRRGLAELGFQVLQEQAVVDGGKVYSAFSAAYQGAPVENGPLYPYLGKLIPGAPHVEGYARKVLRGLEAQRQGALHREDSQRAAQLEELLSQIGQAYLPQA